MEGDVVANFCAITDADADIAVQYLSSADFNLENAVQLFFAAGGNTESSAMGDAHGGGVRERMESHVDQLINPEEVMFEEIMRPRRRANRPINIFNQVKDADLSDKLSPHERRLAKLFRPPYELISDVPLEDAREIALAEGKWVMVNVQDPQVFACQQINRDLWSHAGVQEIVRTNFIFLQVDCQSSDGEEIRVLYQFQEFPHVSIIDPRTGEEQKSWSRVPACEQFLEVVIEFLGQPGHRLQPQHPPARGNQTSISHVVDLTSPELELSETASADPPERPERSEEDEKDDQEPKEPSAQSIIDSIEAKSILEPPAGPGVTRLQFRLADGGRIVRRFEKSTSVLDLYAFIKHTIPDLGKKAISLTHGRQNLELDLDKTLETAKLENSMILVELQ